MDRDEILWNEAVAIERQHGPGAVRWVAERIVACKLAGNDPEAGRLREIAVRLDDLLACRARG